MIGLKLRTLLVLARGMMSKKKVGRTIKKLVRPYLTMGLAPSQTSLTRTKR